MDSSAEIETQLLAENERLRARLDEVEETLRAIQSGEIDALVVQGQEGNQIFTLQGAERPYRVLVESMQEGALTLSVQGTILYCNHRFADMVGSPLEKVLGADMKSLIVVTDQALFQDLLQDRQKKKRHAELMLQARNT